MAEWDFSMLLLLLILLLASTATNAKSPWLRQKARKLQDPCAIPYGDVVLNTPSGLEIFIPSYVESCLASVVVNDTLMIEHISSLQEAFRQFYAFYNVANDPAATTPGSFQEELGYTLFSGPLEGQVNMHEEFSSFIETVSTSGASLATFWDIQEAIGKLRDAHVSAATITGKQGELVGANYLTALAERTLVGTNGTAPLPGAWTPSYNDAGELELVVSFIEPDGSETTENITEINGMTPYEWYYDLASKPSGAWPYQSIGARMNSAFTQVTSLSGEDSFTIVSTLRPSAIFPDSFTVKYASGTEETYFVGLLFPSFTVSEAYDIMNSMPDIIDQPGSAYLDFLYLAFTAINVTGEVGAVRDLQSAPKHGELNPAKPKAKAGLGGNGNTFEFDEVITIPNELTPGTALQVAFTIEDDFAVLKIPDFAFASDLQGNPFAIVEIWSNLTKAAKEKGVKKLIIDISANGGGVIVSGNALAISMYPFVPYEFFASNYDQNYNDIMRDTNSAVFPLIDALKLGLGNLTDTNLQAHLDTLPESLVETMSTLLASITAFCCKTQNISACEDPTSTEAFLPFFDSLATLDEFRTGPQLRQIAMDLLDLLSYFNAFNTLGSLYIGVDPSTMLESTRGGVAQNLTNRFPVLSKDEYHEIVARSFQNDFMFDEYVLVSDGTGGSTTAIFSSMVQQLWNNRATMWEGRNVPPIPLTTVTYGGSKDPADITLAGFPASVQGVNLGMPIITAGLLYMMEFLLPPDEAKAVREINEDVYQNYLPVPPYFSEGLVQVPVFNYYDHFMDPGAMPLQYVKMNSDAHIQQIYTRTSLEDSGDLAALYKAAAALGFSVPAIVEESEDEALETSAMSRDGASTRKEGQGV